VTGTSRPRLAFSTLACPEWDALSVVERAAAGGWDGVEWRGGPDGTVRIDWPRERRAALRRAMDGATLASIAVTTYTDLVNRDPAVVEQSIADAVAHAELAADLGAAVIRVFLGEPTDDAPVAVLTGRAIPALERLLAAVRPLDVAVAIEAHDAHVAADTIRPILDALPDATLGVVWDIGNAWSIGEPPAVGLAAYAGRIRYVQVKDGIGVGPSWHLTDVGAGEVALDDALAALARSCTETGVEPPPISLEWERAWHHHLTPAEIALPRARAWLVEHVSNAFVGNRAAP
jgi:sugar phosphate isomerase/epimerase